MIPFSLINNRSITQHNHRNEVWSLKERFLCNFLLLFKHILLALGNRLTLATRLTFGKVPRGFACRLICKSFLSSIEARRSTTNGTQDGGYGVASAAHATDCTSNSAENILIALEPIQRLRLHLLVWASVRRDQASGL